MTDFIGKKSVILELEINNAGCLYEPMQAYVMKYKYLKYVEDLHLSESHVNIFFI